MKSSPIGTGYPLIAFGSRAAYKVAMVHNAKVLKETRADKRVVAKAAIQLLAMHHVDGQLETSREMKPKSSIPVAKPHLSHEIATLPNHDGIIWCRRCSSWSRNVKLKALGRVCEGLKDGNRAQLRLLQVGIAPYAGVRMPRHLARRFERRRRR